MLRQVASALSPKKSKSPYLLLRALTNFATLVRKPKRVDTITSALEATNRLKSILDIREVPENDYASYKSNISEGSCQWILHRQTFLDWTDGSDTDPNIFWLTGPPAAGKSTLASFVISWIRDGFLDANCQYHFFNSDHQAKNTVAYFLRVMAFQIAQSHESIQEALFRLNDKTGATFGDQNASNIWERVFQGIIFRVPLDTELFWVIDALDEADGPVHLCNFLLKTRSVNRIKIFVTSRRMKDISNILNSQRDRITFESLSFEDTTEDIRSYVTQTLRGTLPPDRNTQRTVGEVIEQILEKANGSFLWVKLTLETISEDWHTQPDIRKAMKDVPAGMEPLYKRMLNDLLNQTPRICQMARDILTWAVCSFRPLRTSELQTALLPKFEGFVNLEETIGQICGHFIQISNGKVVLVHATARQFLLSKSASFLNKAESHEHLALACLQYLTEKNWRQIFALGPKGSGVTEEVTLSQYAAEYPFLDYAIHYWAFHVNNAPCKSDKLMDALEEFFQNPILSWIHGVVLSGNLRTLARTAQHIRAFVHRRVREQSETNEPPLSLRMENPQWLRLWAIDLIRIMGRFGRIMLEEPRSIYRQVPILCPKQSQIGITFAQAADSQMSLSGLSTETWDDCLARVGGSDDDSISKVVATATNFITLLRTSGKATVWSAETCEETQQIVHGEYITHIALNKRGTLLATAGIHTIRTWELASGEEISRFPRNSEAKTVTIAFSDSDASLIIGREDYSVQTCDLETGVVTSNFWARSELDPPQASPKFMMLSPDLNKVALAERGRPILILDRDHPQKQPWRYVAAADSSRFIENLDSWNPPETVCWHPEGTSLFILYLDTSIVHWSFIDETHTEHQDTKARDLTVSKDGNFVLTCDYRGTLSVWILPRFNLIYQLVYEEPVRDFAFSLDSQRIYDSRGTHCNVWEPDVLVRHEDVERDDTSSNHDSSHDSSVQSDPVISQKDSNLNQITALVKDTNDQFYCCGRDDGSVWIHDAILGNKIRKVYAHSNYVSILALEWSASSKYMVSGDDAGRVICKRLEAKEVGKWGVFPVFDIRLKDPIYQLLFDPSESLLLISTELSDIVWSIRGKTKKEIAKKEWPATGRRWVTHPSDPTQLLWIDPLATHIYAWESLERVVAGPPVPGEAVVSPRSQEPARPQPHHLDSSNSPGVVRNISVARSGRHLIVEVVPNKASARALIPIDLEIHLLSLRAASSPSHALPSRGFLPILADNMARLLGFHQNRVLFLDKRFWVCSWDLGDAETRSLKKHFPLPSSWVSPMAAALLTCNAHGTVFCPRQGDVAIVRNGIRF